MADTSSTGRNFIIAGVALGLGAAAAGYFTASSYDQQAVNVAIGNKAAVTAAAQTAKAAYDMAVRDVVVADIAPEGAWIARDKQPGADGKTTPVPDGKVARYTPIFFAPNLWIVADEKALRADVRDILSMENPEKPDPSARVHASVPNEWFFRYGIEGIIGRADAMEVDSDGDGFSNMEEFAAGTDPSDPAKYPAFVAEAETGPTAKMVVVKRHTDSHTIELSSMSDLSGDSPTIVINVYEGGVKAGTTATLATLTRIAQVKDLTKESSFGLSQKQDNSALSKNRFKITGVTADGIEVEDTRARLAEERTFTLQKGAKNARPIRDVEVTLRVTAGSAMGKEIDHAVQVGETFAVPGFPGTECTLESSSAKGAKIKVGDHSIQIQNESAPSKAKK